MLNAILHPTELFAMAKWKLTKDPDAIPEHAVGKNLRLSRLMKKKKNLKKEKPSHLYF